MGTDIVKYAHEILQEEAGHYGVGVGDIVSASRVKHVVEARYSVIQRLYEELDMTFEAIGRVLGGRGHTTIIIALRRARGESPIQAKKRRVA